MGSELTLHLLSRRGIGAPAREVATLADARDSCVWRRYLIRCRHVEACTRRGTAR